MTNAYTTGGFKLTKKNISKLQVRSSVFLFFLLVQRNGGLKYASTILETSSLPYPSFTFGFLRQARGSKMWWHKCEKTNTQGIAHQTPPQNGVGVDRVCNTRLTMCCRNGISVGKKKYIICFSFDEYLLCSFSLTNSWNLPNSIFMIWNSFSPIYLAD